ncbi:MAG TPA: tetratricopeptide repeat protein, partial [Bacteroidota bacterium]|nr:tetratricopeptide repeat protein [Bacteroidota bacterium]
QLLSWLYMEGKHYDRAYTVYKYLDAKTHAGGHELYNFAVRALKEQAFTAATEAFRDVITLYPNIDIAGPVKFGYAQTLEGAEDESDTLKLFGDANPFPVPLTSGSKPRYDDAIAAYNAVIKEFPTTEVAARSLLRIAIIQQEKLFDAGGARTSLETIVKTYRQYPQLVTEGMLRLGTVLIALNDLSMAAAQFQSVAGTGQPITVEQQHAGFHLAELDYFQLHFNDALTKLKTLTANPTSDAANDAIALQIFIQENRQPNDSALSAFTGAELLRRQRKFPDALDRLQQIVQQFPSNGIIDDAFIMTGDIQTQQGRYNDAIATYDSLMRKFPESISIDRTLMKTAQVYHIGLNNSAKAIETYQKLLEKFPNSIYANEARKRTRILRGDTI